MVVEGAGGCSRVLEASSSQSSVINYTQNEYRREALVATKDNASRLGQVRRLRSYALHTNHKNLRIG